jgi:hypothetical protein
MHLLSASVHISHFRISLPAVFGVASYSLLSASFRSRTSKKYAILTTDSSVSIADVLDLQALTLQPSQSANINQALAQNTNRDPLLSGNASCVFDWCQVMPNSASSITNGSFVAAERPACACSKQWEPEPSNRDAYH